MRIKRLELKNFRGFEELTINFPEDSNVAVFVGVNGAGKTSVLEGIVNVLQNLFDSMFETKYSHEITHFIQHQNVANIKKNTEKATINAIITQYFLGLFRTEIDILGTGEIESNFSEEGIVSNSSWNERGGSREKFRKKPSTFIYYPTDRFVKDRPDLKPIDLGKLTPIDVFRQSLSKEIDFDEFFKWFRSIEDSESEQIRFTENAKFRSKELEAVRKAINIFLPNFSNPRVQRQPQEEFIVEKNGEKLSISNLSHGERLMFAMVGDIARRLSIANPGLDDPLQGEGVVLIDEIELHLHPGWQRKIVPLLTKTFPNIQFILTTHSPQVISSVKKESVFLLENFQLKGISGSLGRDSNSILEEVFLISERPEGINQKLEKVYELMDNPEKIGEAKALLHEIEQDYEVSRDEEVMQAKMHLEFLEE